MQQRAGRESHEREDFVRMLAGWQRGKRSEYGEGVDALRDRIDDLAAQLRSAVRTLHAHRIAIGDLGTAPDPIALAREYDDLVALPGVRTVIVSDGGVDVETYPLRIEYRGRIYAVGRFRIRAHPLEGILIERVDATRGPAPRWDHPHVQAARPCLGDLRVGVEKLVAVGQLVPAIGILIQFLQSYDPATAYCPIDEWPHVSVAELRE